MRNPKTAKHPLNYFLTKMFLISPMICKCGHTDGCKNLSKPWNFKKLPELARFGCKITN